MLQLTQGIIFLKHAVRRGIAKLPRAEPSVHESRHLTSAAPWVVLDPSHWPRQVIFAEGPVEPEAHAFSGSSDSLPSSSPASSAAPSIFSKYNSSTSSVLTMPTPFLPNTLTSDDEAEKAGRRSDIEWEYKEMFWGKDDKTKVRHLSESDTNSSESNAKVIAKPWSCEDGTILVQTTYGYSVIAHATGRGSSRTTGMFLKIGMGMDHFDALAEQVAEHTSRKDHEGMVFTSNAYDDLIYDQRSYETWVGWMSGRPAEDRVLWVLV